MRKSKKENVKPEQEQNSEAKQIDTTPSPYIANTDVVCTKVSPNGNILFEGDFGSMKFVGVRFIKAEKMMKQMFN